MRKFVFILLTLILSDPVYSQSGSITDIEVSPRIDGTGWVDVYFNLYGQENAYYISLEVSFDGGNTYIPIADNYTWEDDGPISPGENKHLIWDGLLSCPNTYSSQSIVKLIASANSPTGIPCPGTPAVYYAGQTYTTVLIGSQCWLRENLNIGARINGNQNQANNGIIEKYCYDNNEAYCDSYGGLYQWDEMMQGSSTPGSQGICPSGWIIPSDNDWCILTQFIDPTVDCSSLGFSGTNIGDILKSATGWPGNGNGTNESGFTALPGGFLAQNGLCYDLFSIGHFQTSTQYGQNYAYYRSIYGNSSRVWRQFDSLKIQAFSVRCIKN